MAFFISHLFFFGFFFFVAVFNRLSLQTHFITTKVFWQFVANQAVWYGIRLQSKRRNHSKSSIYICNEILPSFFWRVFILLCKPRSNEQTRKQFELQHTLKFSMMRLEIENECPKIKICTKKQKKQQPNFQKRNHRNQLRIFIMYAERDSNTSRASNITLRTLFTEQL